MLPLHSQLQTESSNFRLITTTTVVNLDSNIFFLSKLLIYCDNIHTAIYLCMTHLKKGFLCTTFIWCFWHVYIVKQTSVLPVANGLTDKKLNNKYMWRLMKHKPNDVMIACAILPVCYSYLLYSLYSLQCIYTWKQICRETSIFSTLFNNYTTWLKYTPLCLLDLRH